MARLNLLEETRFEKLPVSVFADEHIASKMVAQRIGPCRFRACNWGNSSGNV